MSSWSLVHRFRWEQTALALRPVLSDVLTHKITHHLSGRPVLRAANFEECFPEFALNPDA